MKRQVEIAKKFTKLEVGLACRGEVVELLLWFCLKSWSPFILSSAIFSKSRNDKNFFRLSLCVFEESRSLVSHTTQELNDGHDLLNS